MFGRKRYRAYLDSQPMDIKSVKRRLHMRYMISLISIVLIVSSVLWIRYSYSGKYVTTSRSYVDNKLFNIPEYKGEDVISLNRNIPSFVEKDYNLASGEYYSPLDIMGRCGTAVAMLDRSMMPSVDRENIGKVKPSGWNQAKYPGIVRSEPPYLYNRCHLIAYALTGQNANEENLITGTRYMNAETMLPWEKKVMRYLENSDGHVLYRVSPYFKGKELVARGVEMEAYSIEDGGRGICFHIFVYNVQPGIEIDYRTGESYAGHNL